MDVQGKGKIVQREKVLPDPCSNQLIPRSMRFDYLPLSGHNHEYHCIPSNAQRILAEKGSPM